MKKRRSRRRISAFFLVLSLLMLNTGILYAEGNDGAEPETIEAYTLPIESNNTKDWPQGPKIEAEAAIVMEAETGTVLYAKNIKAKEYPASITKLMTVLVALENGNLNDTVTFSEEAVYSIEPGSSHLGIRPGEQLSLRQSLFGIMLASANDISNGVAEHIGGSIEHFVEMMNEKAAELGCINTHFTNAHGLHDDNHYVCAYDMALIAKEVYKYPSFRTITKTVECSFPPTNVVDETRYFVNHQKMLYDEEFKYEGCVGGKTGFTDQALNTLVTYADRDGTVLISVILYLNGSYKTFQESALLLDYGYDNFEKKTFTNQSTDPTFSAIAASSTDKENNLLEGMKTKEIQMDETSTVIVPKGIDLSKLKPEITKKEDDTGTLTYRYNNWPVGTVNLSFQEVPETEAQTTNVIPQTDQTETEKKESEKKEEKQTIFGALNNVVDKAGELVKKADEYILNHKTFCIIICVILLLIFVPMLILTYLRAKKMSKRQKEMEWEKEEIARIEREINEKSAEEVELELRGKMGKERQRRAETEKSWSGQEEQEENEIRRQEYDWADEDDDPDIYDSTAKIYDVPEEKDRQQDHEEE